MQGNIIYKDNYQVTVAFSDSSIKTYPSSSYTKGLEVGSQVNFFTLQSASLKGENFPPNSFDY